jgi:chemotaxis signal transduction protein
MKIEYNAFRLGAYHIAFPKNTSQKILHYDLFKKENPLPFLVKCILDDNEQTYPVIDTRLKLGMKSFDGSGDSCIFVERISLSSASSFNIGLLMDEFLGTFYLSPKKIKYPKAIALVFEGFIKGMCKVKGKKHFIINSKGIFSTEELEEFYELLRDHIIEHSYVPVYNGMYQQQD